MFHWVPPLAYVPFREDPCENIQEFFLPAIAISVFTLAIVMRMVRATMLEVLNLDYVRTARAKGVPRRTVVAQARAPQRADPGGHGGRLRDRRADQRRRHRRDHLRAPRASATSSCTRSSSATIPLVQAATLIIAGAFVIDDFLVDLVYGLLDPRISVT